MSKLSEICSKCGCRMGPSSEGLCPACLLTGVLEHSEAPEPSSPARCATIPQRIEQYELRGEIARGGMGVVYRAEDTRTGRIVALKMLASAGLAGSDELRRFRQEGEAVARLEHPHVVPVYEVGEIDGIPFFVMKVAEGGSLAQQPAPVENRAAATMLLRIARAVQFAHERGVLHRDLKPANILLDADGAPMVCDFGLARFNDREGYTLTGAGIGTPSYMAPEQASGGSTPTTTLSDVYGLGAVLYHQLTGGPPFVGADTLAVLRQLATDDPPPPRSHNDAADRDLEQVSLKAMSKNPADRYRSAAAFADDLERWLRGEPTVARPAGALNRLWKWARRKPAAACAVMLAVAATVAVLAVVARGEIAIRHERNIALEAESVAKKQERKARESERTMRLNLYAADMLVAARALRDGHLGVARETLARHLPGDGAEDLRGFEWYAFQADCRGDELRVLAGHEKSVLAAEFSPDGKSIATGGRDGRIHFWNTATGGLIASLPKGDEPTHALEIPLFAKQSALSPDARSMLASDPGLFDGMRMRWRPSKLGNISALAWSPDGRFLASGSPGSYLRVWEVASGTYAWFSPLDSISKIEFSRDGAYLVAVRTKSDGASGELFIIDTATKAIVRKITDIRPTFSVLVPMDEVVFVRVSGEIERQIIATGAVISKVEGNASISRIAAASDGERIATLDSSGARITIWDLPSGKPLQRFSNPSGERFRDFIFSHDGKELAGVGTDHLLRIIDCETATELRHFRGHSDEILGVRYSPSGAFLATAGNDQTCRIWPKMRQAETVKSDIDPLPIVAAAKSSPHVLIQQSDGSVECWNRETRASSKTPPGEKRTALGFMPDGTGYLTVRQISRVEGVLEHWDFGGSAPTSRWSFSSTIGDWHIAAAMPDLSALAISDGKSVFEFIPIRSAAKQRSLNVERRVFDRFSFTPDGRYMLGHTWPNRVCIWNTESGELLLRRAISKGSVSAAVISPDSKLLASGGDDNVITIHDIPSGQPIATLRGHKAEVKSLAFSGDGKTLASSALDQTLRVWHTATWREMGTLHRGKEFTSLVFTGSPERLIAIGPGGRIVFGEGASMEK
jgi:eukaryotic-like serine/threonine-protein kinase